MLAKKSETVCIFSNHAGIISRIPQPATRWARGSGPAYVRTYISFVSLKNLKNIPVCIIKYLIGSKCHLIIPRSLRSLQEHSRLELQIPSF